MAQGVLPFNYLAESRKTGTTSLAGLPTYLDLASVLGLAESISRNVKVRKGNQGYDDRQMVMSLIMLNLAGGDCVEDLARLEDDEGFARVMRRVETQGMKRQERRQLERRWRKERQRSIPSASAAFRYLNAFCDPDEPTREPGRAIIPPPSPGLSGLQKVNQDLVDSINSRAPQASATLDLDATLQEVYKKQALACYKGFFAYQPLNVFWHELGLVIHSEFRDGNVPAGFEQRRVMAQALEMLPQGVRKVYVRSDTAGYEVEFLRYLAEGQNARFGVIEFAIGADVTPALKKEVAQLPESEWKPLLGADGKDRGQEWAEVVFIPTWVAHKKSNPDYRFLVTRECLAQQPLPGMEAQLQLPFPTMEFSPKAKKALYKLHATVTNRSLPGDEIIRWHRGRCGKSEEVHSIMKSDLAGGRLPSGCFGVNAAWWAIMILALNLNMAMKRLVLAPINGEWLNRRLKALRFLFIGLPGRVIYHARELWIRVTRRAVGLFKRAREGILRLAPA